MDSKNKFTPPGSLYPSPLVLENSEIVPRGNKPIFFYDSAEDEFDVPVNDIPQCDPITRLKKKLDLQDELYQKYLYAKQQAVEIISTYLTALGAVRYHNFLLLDTWAFRLSDVSSNLVKTNFTSYPQQEVEDTVNGSFVNLKNYFTAAQIKVLPQDYTISAFANSYNESTAKIAYMELISDPKRDFRHYIEKPEEIVETKEQIEQSSIWFPGEFPSTPYFHMTFFRGWSFYVPDGSTIDQYVTNYFWDRGQQVISVRFPLDVMGIVQMVLPGNKIVAYGKESEMNEVDWWQVYRKQVSLYGKIFKHVKDLPEALKIAKRLSGANSVADLKSLLGLV